MANSDVTSATSVIVFYIDSALSNTPVYKTLEFYVHKKMPDLHTICY